MDGPLDRFIVVLNFSRYERYVDVPFATNGVWSDLLGGRQVQVDNYWLRGLQVSSNWGFVSWQKA